MKKFSILLLCTVFSSTFLYAFLPPVDAQNDVSLKIVGFDEKTKDKELSVRKIDTLKPCAIEIVLENRQKDSVTGTFRAWMNDDWAISPAESETVTLRPGEKKSFKRTATARKSVLPALYPIHAAFSFQQNGKERLLHPIAIFTAEKKIDPPKDRRFKNPIFKKGAYRLDASLAYETFVEQKNKKRSLGINFDGSDIESGAVFQNQNMAAEGISKRGFGVHPAWKKGWGVVYSDFSIRLPANEKITLRFSTKLGENTPQEPPSDGVEYKIFVINSKGESIQVFRDFHAQKNWKDENVDLSKYAGQSITLRLWVGPGPKRNTTCDRCSWGAPTIRIGEAPAVQDLAKFQKENELKARELAHSALSTGADPRHGQFLLKIQDREIGAGIVPGNHGIIDGTILFSDGKSDIFYHGFTCEMDDLPIGDIDSSFMIDHVEEKYEDNKWIITHWLAESLQYPSIPLRVRIWQEKSGLRMAWDMPGVQRDLRGNPRYSKLGLKAGSLPVWRAYAGFGNVIENPQNFILHPGGFSLSTRHIGGDYTNGMSLVQAADVFPDDLICAAGQKLYSLHTHHDATFTFIPSTKGAFDAARAFRDICGYPKGRGLKKLMGRMVYDEWSGDYAAAAKYLEYAKKYGITDVLFIKHAWQRWGYDYRLPEIYPPIGNQENFKQMVSTAQNAGMLFCPHDNYIDFYPDAEGYSYDHILFNPDGTPQLAWYNPGRKARSYRWAPHAFTPWLVKNMDLMRRGFAPDALFIDVFTAMAPMDYYDRSGKFYPKTETAKYWAAAFDLCREKLGNGAPMISEAGTDALIGSLDAGEADHFSADRWMDRSEYGQSVRAPWHDMVTHGKMLLLGGGLENRYAGKDWKTVNDLQKHGYGSDDYLSNIVIGGRPPLSGNASLRKMVITYWLLHDICKSLGEAEFESHEFGKTIFQQHTTFSNGGEVWSNRGSNDLWRVAGNKKLPQYGFYAKAPGIEAGIVQKNDSRSAFAKTEDTVFVDARPPYQTPRIFKLDVESSVRSGNYSSKGDVKILTSWNIIKPLPHTVPFVHIMKKGEKTILFQGHLPLSEKELTTVGRLDKEIVIHIPQSLTSGKYDVRYGLYRPKTDGARIWIDGVRDGEKRICAGSFDLVKKDGKILSCKWNKISIEAAYQGSNQDQKMITFDSLATDGAFKLIHGQNNFFRRLVDSYKDWILIPVPGSVPFRADISLEAYGAKGATVESITLIDPLSHSAENPSWSQSEDCLSIQCDAKAFAYRIQFE